MAYVVTRSILEIDEIFVVHDQLSITCPEGNKEICDPDFGNYKRYYIAKKYPKTLLSLNKGEFPLMYERSRLNVIKVQTEPLKLSNGWFLRTKGCE